MSNIPGVSLTAATGRYRAEYKRKWLGNYDTTDEAEQQVLTEEREYLYDRLGKVTPRLRELTISNFKACQSE